MRIEQLRYLVAIAQLGSFRRSAEENHLSQASLSETISNLEAELGAQLVNRSSRGASLSPIGHELLPIVHEILDLDQRLRDQISRFKSELTGDIKLGTVTAGACTLLPLVLPRFIEDHPAVRLQATQSGSLQIASAVQRRELDVGLVVQTRPHTNRAHAEVERVPLMRGRIMALVPPGHPLAGRDAITPRDLAGEPLIMFRPGYLMHEVVSSMFSNFEPHVVFYTNDTESARRMVSSGVGVTLLPDLCLYGTLEGDMGVEVLPIKSPFTELSLALLRRRQRYVPAAVEALTAAFQDAAESLPKVAPPHTTASKQTVAP